MRTYIQVQSSRTFSCVCLFIVEHCFRIFLSAELRAHAPRGVLPAGAFGAFLAFLLFLLSRSQRLPRWAAAPAQPRLPALPLPRSFVKIPEDSGRLFPPREPPRPRCCPASGRRRLPLRRAPRSRAVGQEAPPAAPPPCRCSATTGAAASASTPKPTRRIHAHIIQVCQSFMTLSKVGHVVREEQQTFLTS